ncbi:Threonine/homoserine efflux transporter RhtA [Fibrobacter sp. UWR3]|jgi:drug/metabolite transporter (DMT)-like permease|uniref:EamA family transporter n=1 Tax=Fibrobacter sp. UWR3 TaxID=1896217 RepID=UPI0009181537|nr:DMT family transporter [Fibrobacter sp. UWR3]SHM95056.1 Threonine/homoserine efflux transporter RhtA [Fibrobacter sp. UWR3]
MKKNNFVMKGFAFAALSAICYGTNPLGALHLYAQNYSPETVLFYRFFTAALLLFVVILAKGSHFKISFREFGALVAFGFLFAVSSLTYYASFKYMDAGLASTLLFLYPLEVSVLMAVFFKEKIKTWTIVSIAVSMAGVALLYRGGDGVPLSTVGLMLAFASSISYAIYMVMANRIKLQMGSVKMTFYAICFCLVFLLLYSVTLGSGLPPVFTQASSWGWGFMLGLVPTVLSLIFMVKAVKIIGSTPTAILGALEPVTAVTIGVLVFGEVLTGRLIAGILLILGSTVLIAAKRK